MGAHGLSRVLCHVQGVPRDVLFAYSLPPEGYTAFVWESELYRHLHLTADWVYLGMWDGAARIHNSHDNTYADLITLHRGRC